MSTEHTIKIHWGTCPESATYTFATEAELRAFLLGVDEATGWTEFEIIEMEAS